MCQTHHSRFSRIAIAASGIALMLGGSALAQTVQMFDDAPSLEQLRSIMIPESRPGVGRTIVIQRPDTGGSSSSLQRVATQVMPAARTQPAVTSASAAPVEQVAASVPAAPRAQAAKTNTEAKAGAVGMRINFGFDSAMLPDSAHAMVDVVAQVMKESPDIKVRVEGHTDAVGSADYNATLSERRALSVGEYLVKMGIDPSRLELVGKGMSEPLTRNPYDPNNRRVQFVRVS